jgi:hypothetical protein
MQRQDTKKFITALKAIDMKSHVRLNRSFSKASTCLIALSAALMCGNVAAQSSAATTGHVIRSAEGPWVKSRVLVLPKAGLTDVELSKILSRALVYTKWSFPRTCQRKQLQRFCQRILI